MQTKLRYADLVLMTFVVAIAAMLIVPLPTALLDVLLVINLSFSILLLLVGLYVANSAALYTFPTILLLSTLFRLGLNVASSRLILSQGDAGRVIEAFGTFLIRGEVLVGVIIFAIVTVVNFIVISKGALRVSEVAARFALDALPGKQMVIDNDVRAGLLSAEEARKKRDELRRESQLYGSMDGAMKFVQGDAIAGLFIIAVNICGGMFMGVSGGLSLSDAVGQYTVLTVGDGLVTQIPGLLTSICAGIIVTRVSSSEASSLSADLRSQLFSQPLALLVTSAILLLFALLPGLPTIPFLAVALVAGIAGVVLYRRQGSHSDLAPAGDFSRMTGLPLPPGVEGDSESESDAIVIQLDSAVLYRSYRASVSKYVSWWNTFRASLHSDVGLLLPNVRVASDDLGATSSYRVTHGGIEMFSGRVLPDALLVEISCSHAPILGLKVLEREDHPLSGHRIFWTNYSPKTRKMLEAASIRSYDFFEFLGLRIAGFALQHPEEFLSATDVHSLLRQVEKRHPGLIGEGFGREFVSVPKLTEILQELIRQGLTIRDFKSIAEGVASFCSSTGTTLDNDSSVDVAAVVDHMRTGRRRQMLRRFIGSAKTLRVITLSEELEQLLQDSEVESRSLSLAIESETFDAVGRGLQAVLKPALEHGVFPVAILCPEAVKSKVVAFTRSTTKRIFVLTFGELEPAIPVEQVGIWGVASR